jgi:hypothetical protein
MSDESKWWGHVPGKPESGAEQAAENCDSRTNSEKNIPPGLKLSIVLLYLRHG